MTGTPRTRPRGRYRVTVVEIVDGQPTTVMDTTGEAFHAIVGTLDHDTSRLRGEHCKGGPQHLLEHLADLITANVIYPR